MTNENVPAKRDPRMMFMQWVDGQSVHLKTALEGTGVKASDVVRALKTQAMQNPDMMAVTKQSLWLAILRACRDGLIPDGTEGAIVPFKDKATFIPMYQGLLRQFRRSGKFKSIYADVVREGDEFDFRITEDGPRLNHVPGDGSGKVIKAYATAVSLDGGKFVTVLPLKELNKIKRMSRAKSGPWQDWEEEMQKKTALRRLSKILPNVRDLPPDEDDDEIEKLSQITIEQEPQRPRLVGAEALDEFAGGSPEESAADATAEGSGDGDSEGGAVPATSESEYDAYQRGKLDRSKGVQQRGIPGELREPARSAEAIAWTKGWKGEPL